MPQKLNKAGKMQDYIPKGNGDASGEYGTSNGTNKNYTTSDKNKANVITENKSVVVENKGTKTNYVDDVLKKLPKDLDEDELEEAIKDELNDSVWYEDNNSENISQKEFNKMVKEIKDKYKGNNKANVIDGDLTGKKEESFEDFYNNTFYTKDGNFYKKSGRDGSVKKISQKDYELNKDMANALNEAGKKSSQSQKESIQKDTMGKVLNKQFIPFDSIGADVREPFKKQVVNDFYKLHKDSNHTYTEEEVKKVVDSYNAWYSGSFTKQEIRNLTDALNKVVK